MKGEKCCRLARVFLGGLLLLAGWGLGWWMGGVGPADRGVGEGGAVGAGLEEIFARIGEDPELAGVSVGFCVLDEQGRVVLASALAGVAMPPASALKTLTSAAALEVLTPEFRFETRLVGGVIDGKGVMNGDLVLLGGGDPTLGAQDLDALAAAVVAGGLKRIEGRVVADSTIFPLNPLSDHWNWGDVGNAYGAGAYGLNVDHNRLTVRFSPGASAGAPAAIAEASEAPPAVAWVNEVVTGGADSGDQVVAYSEPYGKRITLRGTVPLGVPGFEVRVANPNPPALAVELLRAALVRRGIEVVGEDHGVADGEPVVLARHRSVPLGEIVAHLHRVSDNLEAQCLFLMLGKQAGMPPSDALRDFWQLRGVEFAALRILDGSGLARANMIRPLDLAAANHRAARGRFGAVFQESLTSYDGGRVRAKIGAMSGVRTEVGFISLPDRPTRTYALMTNGLARGASLGAHRAALLELAAQVR